MACSGCVLRELAERARRPVAQPPVGDEPVHDADQRGAPSGPNFTMPRFSPSASSGSIVFDISTTRPQRTLHLHLFVAERRLVGLAVGEEQRVVVV